MKAKSIIIIVVLAFVGFRIVSGILFPRPSPEEIEFQDNLDWYKEKPRVEVKKASLKKAIEENEVGREELSINNFEVVVDRKLDSLTTCTVYYDRKELALFVTGTSIIDHKTYCVYWTANK